METEIFMFQLDHVGILALIAGSYTPLLVCTIQPPLYTLAIATVWAIAIYGTRARA
jgi:channel protein (hemolysin III family)